MRDGKCFVFFLVIHNFGRRWFVHLHNRLNALKNNVMQKVQLSHWDRHFQLISLENEMEMAEANMELLMLSDRSGVEMPVATNEELQLLSDWKPHNSLDDESSHVSSRKRRRLVHLLSEELQSGYMPGVMRTLYAKSC